MTEAPNKRSKAAAAKKVAAAKRNPRALPAIDDASKTYIVQTHIEHDGKRYKPGDKISLGQVAYIAAKRVGALQDADPGEGPKE
jgi:hypothetical protein